MQCATATCLITNNDAIKCCAPAPPALCSSIKEPSVFCSTNGNNGLIDDPESEHCLSSTCVIVNDAAHCCNPAADAATCASVADPSTFCINDGANGALLFLYIIIFSLSYFAHSFFLFFVFSFFFLFSFFFFLSFFFLISLI